MPPKAKFTKQEVISAALDIIRKGGLEALTARGLGKALGCSSCPIFTLFENMEQVEAEAIMAAKNIYGRYVACGLNAEVPFKGVGMEFIRFASEEPKLFQLIFMSANEKAPDVSSALGLIDENSQLIVQSVKTSYPFLSDGQAARVYEHMSIYSHGIAVMLATGTCRFDSGEIGNMLTEMMTGILLKMKGGDDHD